mmetsp:Transcript_29562/g.58119  ORF Transcript_29562/g.58119 Transcript_29562/m.58119 type:complete len:209 (-) Transcript_29562:2837-3463(-)
MPLTRDKAKEVVFRPFAEKLQRHRARLVSDIGPAVVLQVRNRLGRIDEWPDIVAFMPEIDRLRRVIQVIRAAFIRRVGREKPGKGDRHIGQQQENPRHQGQLVPPEFAPDQQPVGRIHIRTINGRQVHVRIVGGVVDITAVGKRAHPLTLPRAIADARIKQHQQQVRNHCADQGQQGHEHQHKSRQELILRLQRRQQCRTNRLQSQHH